MAHLYHGIAAPRAARFGARMSALLGVSMLAGLSSAAHAGQVALPTGGSVAAGQASIAQTGNAVTITQSSSRAIINWSGFSIGQGGSVTINNGSGATLDRVTGTAVSQIDGTLSATGSVYLLNPNGVVIGKTGVVSTGGSFVATTLGLNDASFLAGGALTFTGTSRAAVVNLGKIGSLGGNVALIGASVTNRGTIDAPGGSAGLLAGTSVLIDDTANDAGGLFKVLYGAADTSAANGGVIAAANVALLAQAGNVYALAGNSAGTIDATGIKAGDGHVMLISESGSTQLAGTISASGANGGAGSVETSGRVLNIGTASVNAHGGQWLLDPTDLTVDATAAGTIDAALNLGTSVTLQTTSTGASGIGTPSSGAGDITIASAIGWNSAATLTLEAWHSIVIDAPITVSGPGGATLTYNSAATDGTLSFGLTGAGFTGSISYAPDAATGEAQAGQSLTINGSAYQLLFNLNDIAGINNGSGNYALAQYVNAAGTTYTNAIVTTLNGTLEGLGNTIANLTINAPEYDVGLLSINNGTVRDIGIVNGTINNSCFGCDNVGELIAVNNGFVVNSYSSGAITGQTYNGVGGLVGVNAQYALISGSFSSASTTGLQYIGGLAGSNQGTISNSFATGTVHGTVDLGGLVGSNDYSGTITNAFATGAVIGGYAGGLAGDNSGTINNSYATGEVTGSVDLGGLIGISYGGTITNSFWDIITTGRTVVAGQNPGNSGSTGLATAALQDGVSAGALGSAFTLTQGLYPYLTSFFPNGVQVVSGTGASAPGAALVADINGTVFGSATAGANGYFYIFAPSNAALTRSTPANLLVYNQASGGGAALSLVDDIPASGLIANATLVGGELVTNADVGRLSQLTMPSQGNFIAVSDGSAAAVAAIDAATARVIINAGALTLDQPISSATSLTIDAGGAITGLAGNAITMTGNGASLTLATTSGDIVLASPISLADGALAVNAAGNLAVSGITGAATVQLAGNRGNGLITLDGSITSIGNQNFDGAIALGADITIDSSVTNGTITFSSTIDGAHALAVNAGLGLVDVAGAVGGGTALSGFSASAGTLSLAGAITTGVGGITLDQANPYAVPQALALNAPIVSGGAIAITNADGAISLGSGASVVSTGGSVLLAANGAFTNTATAGANAVLAGPGAFVTIYTQNTYDTMGELAANTLGGLAGADWYNDAYNFSTGQFASAVPTGNHFVTSYQATIGIFYTATPTSSIYGTTPAGLTGTYQLYFGTLLNGDQLTGTAQWTTLADSRSNVGYYGVTGSGLGTANNYTILEEQAGSNATALNVTARPITVTYTASSASSVYGDTPTGLAGSYQVSSGTLVNGDQLTGTARWATMANGISSVGSYAVTGSGLGASTNYTLTVDQAATNASALTITARPITVTYTAATASSVYGDTPTGLSGSYQISGSGLVNGDQLTGTAQWTTTANGASNVGTYAVTGAGLGASTNYTLTVDQAAANPSALTITARPITVTYFAETANSVYGDMPTGLTGIYDVSRGNLVNGDQLTGIAQWSTTANGTSNVGSYAVTGTGLGASTNYTLTVNQAPGNAAALAITSRPITLTYTAASASSVYGDTPSGLGGTYQVTGGTLVNGDQLSGTAQWTTTATGASDVGKYAITGSGIGAGANYALTVDQAAANASALTITARPITLTYTATATSSVYGDTPGGLSGSYQVTGGTLVNGDQLTGTAQWTTAATGASNVGTYAVAGSGLGASANYTLTVDQAAANATALAITARPITVTYTATAASSVYGDTPGGLSGSYQVSSGGLVNGDQLTGATQWTTAATGASNVGAYAVAGSGLGASTNYTLTIDQAATNATALTITARPIAVTYTATAASSVYGDTPTGLTGSYQASGLVNGDQLTGTAQWTTAATGASGVGTYAVAGSGLGASANYTLTVDQAAANATALTITVRPITLTYTATPTTSVYGTTPTGLSGTYQVSSGTLVNGDQLTGTAQWTTDATSTSPLGSYAVTGAGLGAGGNYLLAVDQAAGNATALTVTPVPNAGITPAVTGTSQPPDGSPNPPLSGSRHQAASPAGDIDMSRLGCADANGGCAL